MVLRRRRALAATVTLLGVLAAACGNDWGTTSAATTTSIAREDLQQGGEANRDRFEPRPDVPGVTDDEIRYSVIGTKTGNPLGTCILDCYVAGIEAYFAYRNSQGGIYGRDLVVGDVIDDELGMNQQRTLDVISRNDSFGVFEATLLPSGWGDLDAAGIPTYTWGIHAADSANRPHNFPSAVVRCADCARPGVPYAAGRVGATKAASIGYGISENSRVCAQTTGRAFERFEPQTGVELVYLNDDLDYGLSNGIGPQVSAMKAAGVDVIATCIDLNGMKTLAAELRRQGMDDVILFHPNSYDRNFIAESGGLFEGDLVQVLFRPFQSDAEGTALTEFEKWMAAQGSEPTELAMVGWLNASLAFDGLLAAGPEFDRERVTAATNALEGWTAGGLVSPIDWAQAHTPYTEADPLPDVPPCIALVRVRNNAFVPFGSPDRPWLCWTGADTDDPVPTDFE